MGILFSTTFLVLFHQCDAFLTTTTISITPTSYQDNHAAASCYQRRATTIRHNYYCNTNTNNLRSSSSIPTIRRQGRRRRHHKSTTSWLLYGEKSGAEENLTLKTEHSSNNNDDDVKIDDLIDMDVVIYSLVENNQNNDDDSSSSNNNNDSNRLYFGAMQEDGIISPLSVWSTEPVFGESLEFLVDEEDRFSLQQKQFTSDSITSTSTGGSTIRIHHLLTEAEVSYSNRQCQRGVGNPHGEESELLYYIPQHVIDQYNNSPNPTNQSDDPQNPPTESSQQMLHISINPDLEILW